MYLKSAFPVYTDAREGKKVHPDGKFSGIFLKNRFCEKQVL